MGNGQDYAVASLIACSSYVVYVYIYGSYKLLKTNVLNHDRLPSVAYLYIRFLRKALTLKTGRLSTAATPNRDVVYTVFNCRLETPLLRKFCSAAGYGWDYPDSLVCVRQSLKTLQPVDELKKGPFTLEGRVLQYRQMDVGVEVDICLSATSRSGCLVWESVLTLLSQNKLHKASGCLLGNENKCQPDELVSENVRQVEVKVPRTAGMQSVWSLSDYSSYRLLYLPARFLGYRSQTSTSLWMLSVCLAEIEKHKGVGIITAPVNITAQFRERLLVPRRMTISKRKQMRTQGKGDTASIPLASPTGSDSVQVYHDYQKVAFKMYPGNGHATENHTHSRREEFSGVDAAGRISSVPDVICNSPDQRYSMKDESAHRNSSWMMDSSSQAYSGPEDNSTDPHETLTETSTLTFVDAHTTEESAENHSLHGVGMVYLKEFVLIDDDDDGDMSLREKTVTDLSVMDGKAADLVCGRLLSTSSGSVSECKEGSPAPEMPPPEETETAPNRKRCCFCTIL
ncbi:uncharacterized protein V6R79_018487 [Siganus canaliculatus]